jgi:hypothetical protein
MHLAKHIIINYKANQLTWHDGLYSPFLEGSQFLASSTVKVKVDHIRVNPILFEN